MLAACFAGACAIALVVVLVTDGAGGLLAYAPWLLLPAAVVWAVFWNPRVVVDDSGLTLVNVLRTVRLPWPAIQDVDTRWALKLHTAYGTFGAWAAPSAGRYASRGISPNDIRHLPEEQAKRRSAHRRLAAQPVRPGGRGHPRAVGAAARRRPPR